MPINFKNPNLRIFSLCILILTLDQTSKLLVQNFLPFRGEHILIDGFFRIVHWGNTGAALSLFQDNNTALAIVGILAAVLLYLARVYFGMLHPLGQTALGLILGGILGNLIDRFRVRHVIDFLYFYTYQRDGGEIGFPAFNLADTAICTGIGLLLFLSWRKDPPEPEKKILAAEPRSPTPGLGSNHPHPK